MKKILLGFLGLVLLCSVSNAVQLGQGLGDKVVTLEVTSNIYTTAWTDYSTTSTVTGFTGGTKTIRYMVLGKTLYFIWDIVGGSGSGTAVSFTLPIARTASWSGSSWGAVPGMYDNGAPVADGSWYIGTGGLTVSLLKSASAAWVATGARETSGQGWYEID